MILDFATEGEAQGSADYDEEGESRRCCRFSELPRGNAPPRALGDWGVGGRTWTKEKFRN